MCPASRCTHGFAGHVTKAYVSDTNQIMVAYWLVYGEFSLTLYNRIRKASTTSTFGFAQVFSCSNQDGTKGIRYEAMIDYSGNAEFGMSTLTD